MNESFWKSLGPLETPRGLKYGLPELMDCNMRKAADASRRYLFLSGFFAGLAVGLALLAVYAIYVYFNFKPL